MRGELLAGALPSCCRLPVTAPNTDSPPTLTMGITAWRTLIMATMAIVSRVVRDHGEEEHQRR